MLLYSLIEGGVLKHLGVVPELLEMAPEYLEMPKLLLV
jgi:hypothetical protein